MTCSTANNSNVMIDDNNNRNPDLSIIEPAQFTPIEISEDPDLELSIDHDVNHHVHILAPESATKSDNIEELYFKKSKKLKEERDDSMHEVSGFQPSDCKCKNLDCLTESKIQNKKESIGASSGADSVAGSGSSGQCAAELRAEHYHNKLLATMQILQNKEETVRVQTESLRVAEARIAALTERVAELRQELNYKTQELRTLKSGVNIEKIEKNDVSITTEIQEMMDGSVVNTLQSNLSVIEELYRECFYETAKQEELIELLRNSYLDVRLLDRQKTEQIERLKSVVSTQKWSLERCQDIAIDVENLKLEISNFLNNSSNDSGMWEREDSLATEVGEELQEISGQLLQLRDMLTGDCTCGLDEENKKLKQSTEGLQIHIEELRQKVCELESALVEKTFLGKQSSELLEQKEKEMNNIRQQLRLLEEGTKDQSTTCDTLTRELHQAQVLIKDKTDALIEEQERCQSQHHTIRRLQKNLEETNRVIEENKKIRAEVCSLSAAVQRWRAQLPAARAAEVCRQDQERRNIGAAALQAQLEQAQARGEAVSQEARRVVRHVRGWMRRVRAEHSEQENKIKEQEATIDCLRRRLREEINDNVSSRRAPSSIRLRKPGQMDTKDLPSCSRVQERVDIRHSSESEIASCSSAPIPPRRAMNKMPCHCPPARPTSVQWLPCASGVSFVGTSSLQKKLSTEEVMERVEQLCVALDSGQRRWARAHPT